MDTIDTVKAADAKRGDMGQKLLVEGGGLALRLWEQEPPGQPGELHRRDYETLGYVFAGRVELTVDDATVELGPGDSWRVPKGAPRSYHILETLTAIEATRPPGRDEGAS